MRRSSAVLPVIDAVLGTVSFGFDGEWQSYWVSDPAALLSALANQVQPSRWQPESGVLTVTVACTGVRAGAQRQFVLLPAPVGPLAESSGTARRPTQ